jgi:hypothetical protein
MEDAEDLAAEEDAGEVIAREPAEPPAPSPAAPTGPVTLTPLAPSPAAAATAHKDALALEALLARAHALALEALHRLPPAETYQLPEAQIDSAARLLVQSPAIKAAAAMLAMWATTVEG